MRNVRENPNLAVTIAYCITKQNAHCVEQAVIDWARAGATHMTFDFYTPIETINEDLWMDFPERDRMLDKLIALKRIYRDFIVLPERAFQLMKSENYKVGHRQLPVREEVVRVRTAGRAQREVHDGPQG